ncbi:MAG: hypothetical protein GY839_07260 [candidate division Zixibacteria bacterium]|nr:hypothetical protein [candidate division Zixibacteria bacterium]
MKKRIKIPLAGFSFVLFLIVLALYLYFFTTVPEQLFNDWVGHYLSNKLGYRVTVSKVSRDIWKKAKFEDINVYYSSDGELKQAGHINSIEAHYSVGDILFQDYRLSSLEISGVNLSLKSNQELDRLFSSQDEQATPGGISRPGINIDQFRFDDILLRANVGNEDIDIMVDQLTGSFGSGTNTVEIRVDSLNGSCPQKEFDLEFFAGEFNLVNENWQVEWLNLKTGLSDIHLFGRIGNLQELDFQVSISFTPLNLRDIDSFIGIGLEGGFDARGHINGRPDNFSGELNGTGTLFKKNLDDFALDYRFESTTLFVDNYDGYVFKAPTIGSGFIDFGAKPAVYEFQGEIQDLNLQNIGPNLYSSFSGEIDVNGEGLSEKTFNMGIDMKLTKADIDIYHLHKGIGEIDFDLKGISFMPGFKANYKNTWITFDGYLEYDGQIDLMGSTEFADLADFKNQIFINDLDGVGQADFRVTGPTLDFTIKGDFFSDSCRFYGLDADTCSFDLSLKSFVSHRVGTVEGYWKGGDIYSIPVDSGYFSTLISGEKNFLEKIYCENKNNQLSFSGSFDNGTIPPALIIDTATVVLWNDTVYNDTPLLLDAFDKEVEFKDFKLYSRSSKLDVQGTVTYDGQMALDINADSLEIRPIVSYYLTDRTISGILSGDVEVGGDFDLPEFDANFSIDNLAIDTTGVGDFNLRAEYSDSEVQVNVAELENEDALYTVTGSIPVNLSFTTEDERFPQEPISATVIASGKSMILIPIFVHSVEDFAGDFNVNLDFSGTYDNPSVNGDFELSDGTLKVLELVDPLTKITVDGRMVNDLVYIDTVFGYMLMAEERKAGSGYLVSQRKDIENTGLILGSGTIKILGPALFGYDLSLSGEDCEFYSDSYDIQGVTDLSLAVSGSSPPLVSGEARLERLDMREPFISFFADEEAEVLEDSTIWDIKLEVFAENNIWINNTESIIEFEGAADNMQLTGDLLVTRENGIYNTVGQLDVVRGSFYLGNYKFKINRGEMIFNKPDTLDPDINFDVTTRIRVKEAQSTTASINDLDLLITGTLTKPQIGTSEGSDYSSEDILYMLISSTVGTGAQQSSAGSIIIDNLLQNLSNVISNVPLVDDIDLTQDLGDESKGTRVSVAKYISPNLYLNYSQRLSQESKQTVGFEYILNNNFSFEGMQGTKDEGVSFNIKLRYEF